MPDVNVTHTGHCSWLLAPAANGSEPGRDPDEERHLDAAACLFLAMVPHEGAARLAAALCACIALLSLLINGVTLCGLARSRELAWQPRFNLLKNLVLSDLAQTAMLAPPVIYSLLRRRTMGFHLWCHLQYFMGTTTIACSLLTISGMALERYLYVCKAIHYLSILTLPRLRFALGLIWAASLGLGVAAVALLRLGRERDDATRGATSGLVCEPDAVERQMGFPRASAVFRKVSCALLLLLCVAAHGFAYLRMYRDALNAVVPFNAVNTRARNTVLFYWCMLLFQLLPVLLKGASDVLWELRGDQHAPSAAALALHMSLVALTLVPPCINPLVYSMRNREVRQVLVSWLRGGGGGGAAAVAARRRRRRLRRRLGTVRSRVQAAGVRKGRRREAARA